MIHFLLTFQSIFRPFYYFKAQILIKAILQMSRYRDLCSSSDSDEEVQKGPIQRGRIRQTQKFKEIKQQKSDEEDTVQVIIPKKGKPKKQPIKPLTEQNSLQIQTNEYEDQSSIDANQKFIRQQVKPVQQQLQHFLDKMQQIKSERKKFTNALSASSRDHQKATKRIAQLKSQQINQKHNWHKVKIFNDNQTLTNSFSIKVKTMEQLEEKVTYHMIKMMAQHEKTIEMITQYRKDMEKTFQKVKFLFLDLKGIDIFNQEKEEYQEYGIIQIYKILQQADLVVQQLTSFSK